MLYIFLLLDHILYKMMDMVNKRKRFHPMNIEENNIEDICHMKIYKIQDDMQNIFQLFLHMKHIQYNKYIDDLDTQKNNTYHHIQYM